MRQAERGNAAEARAMPRRHPDIFDLYIIVSIVLQRCFPTVENITAKVMNLLPLELNNPFFIKKTALFIKKGVTLH